jgi:hypothetical protein
MTSEHLVIGPEGSALVVSKGAKPDTLLISNDSTQKVEYKIEDLTYPVPPGEKKLWYRCLYGELKTNQKHTIDATYIAFRINHKHYIQHVPDEKWHLATTPFMPNDFKAGEYL